MIGLVTGAASGLGKATTLRLVNQGVKGIAAIDLQGFPEDMKAVKEILPLSNVDVTSEDHVKQALEKVKSRFGKLDFVVNCAGVGVAFKSYNWNKDLPHQLETFKQCLDINVVGTFNVTRLSITHFRNNELVGGIRGSIINTASIAAYEGQVGQAAYSASKAAIVGMTLPIARDLAVNGVRCVTIAPGLFQTPLLSSLPDKVQTYLASLVLAPGRLGEPEEFAHAVQMILENPMFNGTTIRLDGGMRMPP